MLSMREKALIGLVITFAVAVTATLIIPVWTYDARLVTNPSSKHFNAPAGEPFDITCKGEADDRNKFSEMKWLNPRGNPIQEGRLQVKKMEPNLLKLSFLNPKTDDSGIYKCIAVYDKKRALQTEVSITFFGNEPKFEITYENMTVKEGSEVKVVCEAMGHKPMTYEWYNQNNDKISENTNLSVYISGSVNISFLHLPVAKSSDSGVYTCIAKNQYGTSDKLYDISILPAPCNETDNTTSSILNVKIGNLTADSIQFLITTVGFVRYIEVRYSESRDATEYVIQWKHGDTYEIKRLIPSGLYNFRFRTLPSDSIKWWRLNNVTLLPNVPEVIFRSLESGSVKIEWFRKFDDSMRGTMDKYELTYYTVQMERGNSWRANPCAVTIQIPACFGSSYTISGLSRNVYYQIELRAHTSSGYGEPYKQKIYLS